MKYTCLYDMIMSRAKGECAGGHGHPSIVFTGSEIDIFVLQFTETVAVSVFMLYETMSYQKGINYGRKK